MKLLKEALGAAPLCGVYDSVEYQDFWQVRLQVSEQVFLQVYDQVYDQVNWQVSLPVGEGKL